MTDLYRVNTWERYDINWWVEKGYLSKIKPDYTLTVDEDGEFRFDGSLRHKNLMMADPGEYVVVRVGEETP